LIFGVRAALASRLLRLPLHFPFRVFLSLSLGGGRQHEATREAWLPAVTGEARLATTTGDAQLPGRRGFWGGVACAGGSSPVGEFARELDLLSVGFVVTALPLICVVLLRFTAFACCRR
jgi:hypothetical protein